MMKKIQIMINIHHMLGINKQIKRQDKINNNKTPTN